MPRDSFGGTWTEVKLKLIAKYLQAYVKVMKNQNYTTIYVDAFAGTGFMRPIRIEADLFTEESETVPAGSAKRALDTSPPFSRYVFVEQNRTRHRRLEALAAAHPGLSIECRQGDANVVLQELCRETDWRKTRAVVFLDPYGMQVEWPTIEALGRTRSVDLWYLVPTGIGIQRVMPREGLPDPRWQARLNRMLGDDGWRQFYEQRTVRDLLGSERATDTRAHGLIKEIEQHLMSRLATVFPAISPHVGRLNNSRNQLYSLVFCCANPSVKAQTIAMRIAAHILTNN